jgi:hypothetical protein
MLVNNELEGMWKEVVVVKFKLINHLPGATEESHEHLSKDSRCPGQYSNWTPLEYKSESLPLVSYCKNNCTNSYPCDYLFQV